jgi:uncharacterized membrane protein YqaE (UPF0057 family)
MKHFKFTSILLILGAIFLAQPSFAMLEMIKHLETTNNDFVNLSKDVKNHADVKAMAPIMQTMLMDEFLKLTPKKFKELTGEKLGLKRTLQLKAAQKLMKNHQNQKKGADISKGLYIVAVIFGWGWLVMGLMDDWSGNDWWLNLLLTFLCWLPGVIHGLIKMKKYYK